MDQIHAEARAQSVSCAVLQTDHQARQGEESGVPSGTLALLLRLAGKGYLEDWEHREERTPAMLRAGVTPATKGTRITREP